MATDFRTGGGGVDVVLTAPKSVANSWDSPTEDPVTTILQIHDRNVEKYRRLLFKLHSDIKQLADENKTLEADEQRSQLALESIQTALEKENIATVASGEFNTHPPEVDSIQVEPIPHYPDDILGSTKNIVEALVRGNDQSIAEYQLVVNEQAERKQDLLVANNNLRLRLQQHKAILAALGNAWDESQT